MHLADESEWIATNLLKVLAAMNILTSSEAVWIEMTARIITAPMNRVTRRPSISQEYGVNGKP